MGTRQKYKQFVFLLSELPVYIYDWFKMAAAQCDQRVFNC